MEYTSTSSARSKGASATRYAMVTMANRGDVYSALEASGRSFPTTPEVIHLLKAAVAAGTTVDPQWAGPLVEHQNVISGFVELLRSMTVLGRLRGLRPAPFNTRVLTQAAGSQGQFVGGARPTPVDALDFASVSLGWARVQTLIVVSQELTRTWTQQGEDSIRNDMLRGESAGEDLAFLDPSRAAVPDVSPASITFGITPHTSSGSTIAAITADFTGLLSEQISYGNPLTDSVWIVSAKTALTLSTIRDASGQLAFPGASVLGGTLLGLPLLVTPAVISAGSPNDSIVVLLNPRRVILSDDGLVTFDASQAASLQMRSDPLTGAQQAVSLWQLSLSAVRLTHWINWTRAGDDAASILDGVQY